MYLLKGIKNNQTIEAIAEVPKVVTPTKVGVKTLLIIKEWLMIDYIKKYGELPDSVKNGVLFLIAGWVWQVFCLYYYFFKGDIPYNIVITGILNISLIIIWTKGWARILCILCNILIIMTYLPVSYTFYYGGNFLLGNVSASIVILFSVSTYYLLTKESFAFFKKTKADSSSEPAPTPGTTEQPKNQ